MELQDTSKKVFQYSNFAIKRKYKNKQIALSKSGKSYVLDVINFDKDFANEPCVFHDTVRGVVRLSQMRMSEETLKGFLINAMHLLTIEEDALLAK